MTFKKVVNSIENHGAKGCGGEFESAKIPLRTRKSQKTVLGSLILYPVCSPRLSFRITDKRTERRGGPACHQCGSWKHIETDVPGEMKPSRKTEIPQDLALEERERGHRA